MHADLPEEFEQEAPAINPADIRLAAMNLLARREHSLKELQQKLRKRFPDATLVDEQLARLVAENLQSDSRYAESYVRQRAGRGFGLSRVRQEMRERGISDTDIQTACDSAGVDWSEIARQVYAKKFGDAPAADMKERARRARFMQYRGFSQDDYSSPGD